MSKIVAVGDSITVGVGAGNTSYIDILGGQKFAIGGKASFSLMGMAKKAAASNPDYVVIFVGINNPMSARGCRGGWESGLMSDLGSMYSYARDAGAKVIGVTIMPAMKLWRRHYNKCRKNPSAYGCCKNSKARDPNYLYDKTSIVNDYIRSNADIVVDAASALTNENGILAAYDSDGIHPNSQAHQWLANDIRKNIGAGGVSIPIKKSPKNTGVSEPVDKTQDPISSGGGAWNQFIKKNPDFSFSKFYKDLDAHFADKGGAKGMLPKYGKDRKWGKEHHAAWKKLQKKKGEKEKLTEAVFSKWRNQFINERLLLKPGPNGWDLYGKLVAEAYEKAPLYDAAAAEKFKKLGPFIDNMYNKIQSGKQGVEIEFVEHDPYPEGDEQLRREVAKTGVLKVFKGGTKHPIFSIKDDDADPDEPDTNEKFRAVHDIMAHIQHAHHKGTGFDMKGELQAYNAHLKTIPKDAAGALFTEVVGQAAYFLNYGHFPKQKIALLPGFDYHNIGVVDGYDIINKELYKERE